MSSHPDLSAEVAAFGLPGAELSVPSPLATEPWRELLDSLTGMRMTGHLAAAIAADAFAVTPTQRLEATERHSQAMALCVALECVMLESLDLLHDAGVPARVLKGSAVAHLDYPDPALRSFGDVDLLVPSECFDIAVSALERAGGRRRFQEPRPGFVRQFGKGVCVETALGFEVDLHRTLVSGALGLTVRLEDLFATAASFDVGGRDVAALGADERFLHACFHAALGDHWPRPAALRDIAEMLLGEQVDHDRVLHLAERWRARAVVARAIVLSRARLGFTGGAPLGDWAGHYEPDAFERRALRGYGPERSYAAQAVGGLWAVHGVRAKVSYARALLVPERGYVAGRDGGYTRRFKRAARLLVRKKAA